MKRNILFGALIVAATSFSTSSWAAQAYCTGYPADTINYASFVDTGASYTNTGSVTYDGTGGVGSGLVICPSATYTNSAGADIDNGGAQIVIYSGGILQNYGFVRASSPGISSGGTINNYSTGTVSIVDYGTLRAYQFNNSGHVTVDLSSYWDASGLNNLSGGLTESYGDAVSSTVIDNSGTIRFMSSGSGIHTSTFQSFVFQNGGTINNKAGGLFSVENVSTNESIYGTAFINNAGTFSVLMTGTGGGYFNNKIGTFSNLAGGVINVGGLDQFNLPRIGYFINSGTLSNQGSIHIVGGSGLNNGQYTYIDPNTYVPGATYTGHITNAGSIMIDSGGTLGNAAAVISNDGLISNNGSITNSGSFTINNSGIVNGTGTFSQSAGTLTVNGLLQQSAITISGGVLNGSGTVDGPVIVNGGTIAPGNSPGLLTFTNSLSISSGGVSIEIGGLTRGTQYDAINAGTIALSGTALLTLTYVDLGGGIPSFKIGDTFDILEATSISGDFTSFSFAPLASGLTWDHKIVTLAGGLQAYELSVAAVPLPSALAMFLPGLGLVGFIGRKKTPHTALA